MIGTRALSLRWRLIGPLIGVWAVGLALLVTVLGAEIARDYKPTPIVYQAAANALDLTTMK